MQYILSHYVLIQYKLVQGAQIKPSTFGHGLQEFKQQFHFSLDLDPANFTVLFCSKHKSSPVRLALVYENLNKSLILEI